MDFKKIMERINRRLGQLIAKAEREIAKMYAKALVEIRSILAGQYEKYEQKGELTLEEMLKHDRLKKMQARINFIMRTHYKDISKHMDKALKGVYVDGYYLSAHAVETYAKVKLGYASVRPESLTAMLNNPVNGLTLNQRLERQRAAIIYQIQQQVTAGLQNRETYSTMAKRLKNELEGDAVKAMRIVRTEGHRVQESGKHDAMEHANKQGVVMHKQWNTLQDQRVRNKVANHRKLDNKKIPVTDMFDDGLSKGLKPGSMGAAGSDINCRCFLTYSVERIEKPQHKELENMAFEEWKKERLKA